jgi:hypothetical protein
MGSNPPEAIPMPEDVRRALLDILRHTLTYIRAKTNNPRISFALSDHAHNIPGIIENFSIGAFRYYWEVERTIFLREMKAMNEFVQVFETPWQILEQFYKSLPPDANRT